MLASSYTFWTQAIIAEVYALHLLMMGLVLIALIWWDRRPGPGRLAVVFGLYALSFGNHLMTVLLAPTIVLFIATSPGGVRRSFHGADRSGRHRSSRCMPMHRNASYLWHLRSAGHVSGDGSVLVRRHQSDWREIMVMACTKYALKRRVAMYQFDVTQRISLPGIALAGVYQLCADAAADGAARGERVAPPSSSLTPGVGDTRVLLPSQMVMLACACGGRGLLAVARLTNLCPRAGPLGDRRSAHRVSTVAGLGHLASCRPARGSAAGDVALGGGPRAWRTGRAARRHQLAARKRLRLLPAPSPPRAQPGTRDRHDAHPALPCPRQPGGEPRRLHDAGRPRCGMAAYGDLFTFTADPAVDARPLAARIRTLAPGTPAVLAVLSASGPVFDAQELADASRLLTGNTTTLGREPSYTVIAGRLGERPSFVRRSDLPWREQVTIDGVRLDVRMESWIPPDTIRRAGFGHVIAGRRHVLTVERGVSLVALSPSGEPVLATYASSLFAPLARYRVTLTPGAWPAGGP
jgi:hypothetical protein